MYSLYPRYLDLAAPLLHPVVPHFSPLGLSPRSRNSFEYSELRPGWFISAQVAPANFILAVRQLSVSTQKLQ